MKPKVSCTESAGNRRAAGNSMHTSVQCAIICKFHMKKIPIETFQGKMLLFSFILWSESLTIKVPNSFSWNSLWQILLNSTLHLGLEGHYETSLS